MSKSIMATVDKTMTKDVPFNGSDVTINKLSVGKVKEIQAMAKEIEGRKDGDDESGLDILQLVVRSGVEGGSDLTSSHFDAFPMDELSKLSNAIMKFSGIGADQGKSE
jgi:hypothetical protein